MIKNTSRTKKATVNAAITLISYMIQILLGFIVRKLFIESLGIAFLGYNSVFQNILQMLNLADLGIGVAITSYLYKPLADHDQDTIALLMYIYKKVYSIIGGIVLIFGVILSFFINLVITDALHSLLYLQILFLINLAGTVSTYYLAYKRTLLIADQKAYIIAFIDTLVFVVMSLLQLTVLTFFPNYILFLLISVGKNIFSNLIISVYTNCVYGIQKQKVDYDTLDQYKPHISRYMKDVFVSRIGAYIYYSTDNIIISIFKGSLLAGYLSNYTLVTTQVNTVVIQVLNAVQATFGNYINTNNCLKDQKRMTDNYLCVNFFIGNFCMLCIMFLIQPFIELVFGLKFVLEFSTAFLLAINFFLTILIQIPSQIFMIYKLYRFDRPIILISAITNILLSSLLVNWMGINGVLIGTLFTSLFYLFSRYYIISKKVFNIPYREYLKRIFLYILIAGISIIMEAVFINNITEANIYSFIFRLIIVGLTAITIPTICLIKTKEFKFVMCKIVPERFKGVFREKRSLVICITLTMVCIIMGRTIYTPSTQGIGEGNKSIVRMDSYEPENMPISHEKIFHLSFDDTIEIFENLTEDKMINSIFDNETLFWFQELHRKYGVTISCYVYYESGEFNLGDCTKRFKGEFEENSDWLRFGFHSKNGETIYDNSNTDIVSDYRITIAALADIVGKKSIDNVIRLQSFKCSQEDVIKLNKVSEEPVIGFLTADDIRISYGLSDEKNRYIFSHDELREKGIMYYSTDLRVEYIGSVLEKILEFHSDAWNNQMHNMIVFSHEWTINAEIKRKIEKLCKWAVENEYTFKFLEDIQ